MLVLLISTYELGRQPFGLASPAAWLREAGVDVTCVDVSRQRLENEPIAAAGAVGFYLPMHTATRLAFPLIERVRRVNPAARVCAFGLYAPLNEAALREAGVTAVFGGEFEAALTEWVAAAGSESAAAGPASTGVGPGSVDPASTPRLRFRVPDRVGLPPLDRYASLQMPDGTRRVAGYTEASRGCKHLCRHCPVVPVYEGRFRVVSPEVVIADVRSQVERGARHITFGDPDFFNGIGHALSVVRAFARECPGVSYDVTVKIEHLLKHVAALPVLAETGCVLVTSAAEAVDDRTLERLAKGHTRADFERAVQACRRSGLTLTPTFVPFTPWTTLEGYRDLLGAIASLDLVDHVAPIQLAIRLLVPNGSRLLELEEVRAVIGTYDPAGLVYPWRHPDPRVDVLQREVERLVAAGLNADRQAVFADVWRAAHAALPVAVPEAPPLTARAAVPFLTEPWYC
ncbi:MAG: radical SAM protein [Acidobacteria bacterium]|nr:radical SAM protein [Acidobacteriota bacterium]